MLEILRCPCCNFPLSESFGGRNRTDGITLFCGNRNCPSNEQPIAWGRTKKTAFNTLVYKYGPKEKRDALIKELQKEPSEPTPEEPKKESLVSKYISNE